MPWDGLQLQVQVLELFAEETRATEQRQTLADGYSVYDHAKKLQASRESKAALPAAERRRRRREEYQRLKSTPEGRAKLKAWRKACSKKRYATEEQREARRQARRKR